MWNLKVIGIMLLLIISSLIFLVEFDDPVCESGCVGVEGVETTEIQSDYPIPVNSRAPARPAQDDAHGGEWLDSFEDDSGIDEAMSDHLRLEEGDAEINYDLDPSAVAVWHFDEGSGTIAYDSTINNNDGILGGDGLGNDLPIWSSGKFGKALSFDGINDYIDCGKDSSLNLSTNDFTVDAWIKISKTGFQQQIIRKGYPSFTPGQGRWVVSISNSNKIRLVIEDQSGNVRELASSKTVTDNNWHYVSTVFDRSNKATIYIDGVYDNSVSITSVTGSVNNIISCFIGSEKLFNQDYIGGLIDRVSISKIARSALEVKDIYENGTSFKLVRQANLTSSAISLPPNMHWDTLLINKTQPDKTYLNITILDASDNQPIPGSPTYTDNGEVDISYIDPVQYPSLKLNATFEGDGGNTPGLHYWAVSWNRSNTWQDTLFGGEKVESVENVEAVDGNVQLEHGGFDSSSTIALWHFDEGSGTTAYDETENDNDGTINGATWTTGKIGKALSFDGVDDYVNIPNESNFDLSGSFSLESWIKTSQIGKVGGIVTKHYSSDVRGSYCLYIESNNKITMMLVRSPNDRDVVLADAYVNDDKWHHLVGTYDGSSMSLYIDGVLDNSISAFGVAANTNDPVKIGACTSVSGGTSSSANFNGLIDDVAIYNRALTLQEVKGLFQYGSFRHQSFGTLTSKPILLPINMYWDTLIINKTELQDTSLNVTILDGTSDQPISSFTNITGTEFDISSLNPIVHSSIKLQASFGSNGVNTSILHDWSVNWTENTAPKFIDVISPTIINRTHSAPLVINLSDREETEEDLTLKIEYKSPSDINWQTNCVTDPYYSTNQWNCAFTPPKDAELGIYSFRITVNDSFQYLNVTTHTDLIEVINNKPTAPNVTISPFQPKTTDDLIVTSENSTDVETSLNKLKYWCHWYKNEIYLPELDNETFIPHTATQKDDTWRCLVYPFDGDGVGVPGKAEVIIQNSPPEVVEPFVTYEMYEDVPAILEEKLLEVFSDLDEDKLTFTATGQNNIDIEITHPNGTIKLTPAPDWFGSEHITFTANDSSAIEAKQTVEVIVKPTNDLPKIIQIGNQLVTETNEELGFVVKQDAWLNLSIIVKDVDGDVAIELIQYLLNITEQSNLYFQVGVNELVFKPTNEDVGQHYISIRITDNNETPPVYVSQNIWIEVVNVNDPPSVKIIEPVTKRQFLETDDITLSCEANDPDLLIPNSNENFTYLWYINKTDLDPLGTTEQIIVGNRTLPPGYYTITVMVKDNAGKKVYDSIEIVIEDVGGSGGGKGSETEDYLWLWLLIAVIIIIVICFLFLFLTDRKKQKLEYLGIAEKQVLTPEGMYKPKVSLASLAQSSQPQAIGGPPVAPVSTQALLYPRSVATPQSTTGATPTPTHTIQPAQLPPRPPPMLPPTQVQAPTATAQPQTPTPTHSHTNSTGSANTTNTINPDST